MNTPAAQPVYQALKTAVYGWFTQTGRTRFANTEWWWKVILYFLLMAGSYLGLLLLGDLSLWVVVAGFVLFNLGSTLFVISVGHDASHRAVSKNRRVNVVLSYAWNAMGISRHLWEIKHHYSHHAYTNVPHQDVDIAESPLMRFSPTYPYKPHYRYQHLYAPVLYLLFGIFVIYARDFVMYFVKLKEHGVERLPRYFLGQLILTKLVYFVVTLVLPVVILPYPWWWTVLISLGSLTFIGAFLLIVLLVPHINEEAAMYEHHSIDNKEDWTLHQIQSTVDSSASSIALNWLTGGLNAHLIHHLFPQICHVYYPALTEVIRRELQQQGIPYKGKSLWAALVDHFMYLKLMGMPPADFAARQKGVAGLA